MATIRVPSQQPTIAAATTVAQPNDTIQLDPGYVNETATVTVNNLIVTGDATNTGITVNLGFGVTNLSFGGNAPFNSNGNNLNNTIIGNAGANNLGGGNGTDILVGGDLFDVFRGGAGNDVFLGGNVGQTVETGPRQLFQGGRADYSTGDVTGSITALFGATATVTGGASVGTDTLIDVQQVRGTNDADTFTQTTAYSNQLFGAFAEFEGRGGNDTITGAAGVNSFTRISYQSAAAGVTVNLQAGTAQGTVAGDVAGVGVDTFTGVNQVRGSSFGDVLNGAGKSGVLRFIGSGGDDQITGSGLNNDTTDFNLASYDTGSTNGIAVSLGATSTVTDIGGTSNGTDTLVQIQAVRGTAFADTFTVAANYSTSFGRLNEFEGMGGNDTITGNGFTRINYSQATAGVTVSLATGVAQSVLMAGDVNVGTDTFTGVNSVVGSTYDDVLVGSDGAQAERFRGGQGNDTINGGGGVLDNVDYRTSTAGVTANLATGVVSDGLGTTDTLLGIEGVRGSEFADTLTGSAANDVLEGQNGNDTILGGGGNDILIGDDVPAVLDPYGDAFGTTSTGDFGNDFIDGGTGSDTIYAGDGADVVVGGAGIDQLFGDTGNDFLVGGADADALNGGAGADYASYSNSAAGVVVNLTTGAAAGGEATGDTIVFAGGVSTIENLAGSTFNDVLTGNSAGNELIGNAGADFFEGLGGADVIVGGEGFDTVSYLASSGAVSVNLLNLAGQFGDASGDVLVGVENVFGSAGGDLLRGDNLANILFGSLGGDLLIGEGGGDYLVGGGGGDVSTGGFSDDFFFFRQNDGNDIVTDFDQSGNDIIVFADFGPGFGLGNLAFTATGQGTLITATGWNGSVLLQGTGFGQIGVDDFLFV